MTKSTPGPWRVGTAGPNGCATIGTHRGLMVAMVAHSLNQADQRDEAIGNANLIAAAPDMLLALRRAVLALAFAAETSAAMRDDYKVVSDAIAKATGAA